MTPRRAKDPLTSCALGTACMKKLQGSTPQLLGPTRSRPSSWGLQNSAVFCIVTVSRALLLHFPNKLGEQNSSSQWTSAVGAGGVLPLPLQSRKTTPSSWTPDWDCTDVWSSLTLPVLQRGLPGAQEFSDLQKERNIVRI